MPPAALAASTVPILLLLAACGGDRSGGSDAASATRAAPPAQTAATPAQAAAAPGDPRAAIFLEKGCPQCHTISALGVKSPAEIGPDLTHAYTDVQSRFSMTLEDFLHNPTGTMQVVLSSQISLSPAERDSVIGILKGIHERHEDEQQDEKEE